MIFFLRVEARANLIAASTASEPELLRKTRPRFPGATERSFSTKAAFAVVPNTGPTWISSRTWASIASTMAGLQCPRLPTPKDAPQSMYSLPSSSQSVATDPRTNVGPRFGAHPNSIARASGTLTRSPCPSLRAPARPGPAEGTMRSPRAPRRLEGFARGDEFLFHPSVGEVLEGGQTGPRDFRDQGRRIARLPEQPGDVRQKDEGLRFHRDRDLGSHTVRVGVDQLTPWRDARRRDDGDVSRVEQELNQARVHLFHGPGVVVLHEEHAAVVHGPHGLLAADDHSGTVEPAQADGGRSERLQPGHDRRVQLPGEGHREDLHRGEVRVPRDDAARGGDPADRPAKGLREPIHLVGAAVDQDVIATGREVDQHVVDPVPLHTAYFDDQHRALSPHTGCRPRKSSPIVSGYPATRFMHWTAVPAAPFMRLSNAATATTRFACASRANPTSQKFVPARILGSG